MEKQKIEVTGFLIFTTELMTGTLLERFKRGFIPSDWTFIEWIKKTLLALKYLHEDKRIVHQDIKLENIFENNLTGEIKLADLGFAVFEDDIYKKKHFGTEGYIAPEIEEKGIRGPTNDIWSLAVSFIKLMTGDNDSNPYVAIDKI